MKPNTLPVKRQLASKGLFKRLNAVTNNRKQRVAATSAQEFENEDSSSKISRALTIIFLIHIVAIGLIFVHQKFLDGKTLGAPKQAVAVKPAAAMAASGHSGALPKLKPQDESYIVSQGDNFEIIATKLGLEESALRQANPGTEIGPGIILKLPSKRIVAQDPPEIAAIRQQNVGDSDRGMVENVDVSNAPRATLVRPNVASSLKATPSAASGSSYVVKSGDSVWRIANRFKVDQKALMKANNISDARKMKIGMNLVIP